VRSVRQLRPDSAEVLRVFDRLKLCPNMFGEIKPDLLEKLIAEHTKFWLVDDVGLLAFDQWRSDSAHVHMTFWDRRLRGREALCKTVMCRLMAEHSIDRVYTVIPLASRIVRAFALRIGFKPDHMLNDKQLFWFSSSLCTLEYH